MDLDDIIDKYAEPSDGPGSGKYDYLRERSERGSAPSHSPETCECIPVWCGDRDPAGGVAVCSKAHGHSGRHLACSPISGNHAIRSWPSTTEPPIPDSAFDPVGRAVDRSLAEAERKRQEALDKDDVGVVKFCPNCGSGPVQSPHRLWKGPYECTCGHTFFFP